MSDQRHSPNNDKPARKASARRASFASGRLEHVSDAGAISRDALLTAAAAAFRENGFAATSIEAVAQKLGATKGLVYHHYRSKNDLFFDVCRRGMELDFAAIEPHALSRERAVTRLKRMAETHVLTMLEHQDFQQVILQGVSIHLGGNVHPDDRETLAQLMTERDRYERLFHDALAAAVAQGDLASGLPDQLAVKALLATVNSPVFWYTPRAGETAQDRASIARDFALFALRGAGAGPATIDEEF
jgi:AcrR family transcriptional regulator